MTTIVDVARAAGVSTATVSRVLNHHPHVDPELAETVIRAVEALGYRPSRVARSLRTRQSKVWVLIISDIRNSFFTDMVRGIEDIAYGAGYSLVLCNAEDDPEKEATYIELALAENASGVILTPASDKTDLAPLMGRSVPVVLVDRYITGAHADVVAINNAGGAHAAVSHLIAGGYKRIGCITGRLSVTTAAERYAGYKSAIEAAGWSVDEGLVRCGNFREQGGLESMRDLLARENRPDAVFVGNNLMTMGALHAIRQAGLRIPRDLGVIGFDDASWATLLKPELTTVAQPIYELGTRTAELLLSRLEGYGGPVRQITLEPVLRVRASSPPRRPRANQR